ncbi:D-alanine--D-alanine ligase, partial [Candidatus Sumerlaeota bacterium]|nr:D-alanine--D-alanine ligase [Candidatus Sumerlaeota bacterium]
QSGKWHWARTAEKMPTEKLVLAVNDAAEFQKHYQPGGLDFAQALLHLIVDEFSTVMIIIHGANGEDGRLQGAFELAGIRYTGSGSAASALAMDKTRCQAFLAARGLPVPPFMPILREAQCEGKAAGRILEEIGIPCVIKPSLCGSSVGVTIVREEAQLVPALRSAFEYGPNVQVEKFIAGREFTCGVLDMEKTTALPVTEIIISKTAFFDYEAKYTPGMTREVTPAEIAPALASQIQALAVEAHRSVGCEGFSRVDFMCDETGPKILEINTIPGMTETSLLPQAAAAIGIGMPQLINLIVEHSIGRSVEEKPHVCAPL